MYRIIKNKERIDSKIRCQINIGNPCYFHSVAMQESINIMHLVNTKMYTNTLLY